MIDNSVSHVLPLAVNINIASLIMHKINVRLNNILYNSNQEDYNSHCSQCAKLVSKCKPPQAYCCWLPLLLLLQLSHQVYSYILN